MGNISCMGEGMRHTKKGFDGDVTVGITGVLYERATLLLAAWCRVLWRAFVSTAKKRKVDIELVSS